MSNNPATRLHVAACDPQDRRDWEKAANKADRSLSSWVRVTLNRAAREQLQVRRGAGMAKGAP